MTAMRLQDKLVEILLVEDSASDIRLTQEALREGRVANHLHVVRDGEEALSFLRCEMPYEDAPRPGLILLDLNLPKKDGREVLDEIKKDFQLKTIPVCVLTTSDDDEDVLRSYHHYANCYITKPVDVDEFINKIRGIREFWFEIVKLPQNR